MTARKILVFGSREWQDEGLMRSILSRFPEGTILIHGAARGADMMADRIGKELGFVIRSYPVSGEEWTEYGKVAGHLRNAKMLREENPGQDGIPFSKAFGFATGPVLPKQNKGTFDMSQKLWDARVRFEILFPLDSA